AAASAPSSFEGLKETAVTRIAIGEPTTVPAGQYAMQALTAMKLADVVRSRLVYGSNVRQVLDYVERGEVAAGIVYATDAKAAGENVRVTCTIDAADHEPIVYPAVLVKASSRRAAAARFLAYLLSDKGQARLKQFCFA